MIYKVNSGGEFYGENISELDDWQRCVVSEV